MKNLRLSTQILIIVLICLVFVPLTTVTVIVPVYTNATLNDTYEALEYQLSVGGDHMLNSFIITNSYGGIVAYRIMEDEASIPFETLNNIIIEVIDGEDTGKGRIKIPGGGEVYYAYKTQAGNKRIVFSKGMSLVETFLGGGQNIRPIIVTSLFMLLPVVIIMFWFTYVSRSVKSIELSLSQGKGKKFIASKELQSLSDSIEVYKNELEQATEQKRRLMQNISHELKTPITTIKMYAEGIEDGIYRDNDIKKSTQVIKEESDVLLDRVNKIMDINKLYEVESEDLIQKSSTVILSEVVFECLEKYSKRAPNVKFDAKLERAEWRGTKEIWSTIIENIFDNNIRHGAKNIEITVKKNLLVIENDGEKIEEKILPRIFEPFMKGEHGNFGLGLNIIQRSLGMLDYTVQLQNTEKGVMYKVMPIV